MKKSTGLILISFTILIPLLFLFFLVIPKSSGTTSSSSSSLPKYTIMNEMNTLGFAVSVTNYEDVAAKISEYSLSGTQKDEANYIKQIASRNKGRLVLGLLSGGVQVLAWTDGNNSSEFYFRTN
jgi:hypothetical protein